jgi:hypothetical protein
MLMRLTLNKVLPFIAVATLVSANAQTLVDTWSAVGGAWTPANQPDFVAASPGGGILYTDEAIANETNNSADNTGAIWNSIIPPPVPDYPGIGIYDDYYYTVYSTPTITLSTANILDGVQTITFTLISTDGFDESTVALNFGGLQPQGDFEFVNLGPDPIFPANRFIYTWTWDVSALTAPEEFSLTWTTPVIHTPYFSAEIVQAVPEPSTVAMAALGLSVVLARSRRRRANPNS